MPASTKEQIDRLQPDTVVVLGGTSAVSDAAATGRVLCIPLTERRTDFEQCLGLPSDPAACTETLPPAPKE